MKNLALISRFLTVRAVLAILSVIALCSTQAFAQRATNILLILTDDVGREAIGCYGGEIPTPNIERLAADGARFSGRARPADPFDYRSLATYNPRCGRPGSTRARSALVPSSRREE